ncbi:MAG: acyl-CoA reductase [Eubacteriales bacterium]|jgi:hypothetical protein|nr:acyl-CoA reductase [Eubacteriales bacterium]
MNLMFGSIVSGAELPGTLARLEAAIEDMLSLPALSREAVIAACDMLSNVISEETYLPLLCGLGLDERKAKAELCEARKQLSGAYLTERVRLELGDGLASYVTPLGEETRVRLQAEPLGVLLHITAGNADALPFYSVLEGLLTGNINIVKLPREDNGLTNFILLALMRLEPRIAERVFVFDTASDDADMLHRLSKLADGIVVWGGDQAIKAARSLADPGMRVIEWGHKLSFAYLTPAFATEEVLVSLAHNICQSEQLLCNSCQGIYLDTDRFDDVKEVSARFLCVLDRISAAYPRADELFVAAKRKIELYTCALESDDETVMIFESVHAGVIACRDRQLSQSFQFRMPWVKPLPHDKIIEQLRPHKGYLQTCTLCCEEAKRNELEHLLLRAGVVRITCAQSMLKTFCGLPHDGEYALARLQRIVSVE